MLAAEHIRLRAEQGFQQALVAGLDRLLYGRIDLGFGQRKIQRSAAQCCVLTETFKKADNVSHSVFLICLFVPASRPPRASGVGNRLQLQA